MDKQRLRTLLREASVPDATGAERRGLAMVRAAYAERRPARRSPLPRLALAAAIGALLAGLLLTPAGAAVRHWVGDVFDGGVPDAEKGLSDIPGGGHLLVQSAAGPWVVQPDGSRRLLGQYAEATWSPRGLFVGAAAGRGLTTVEPDGTPRWSLAAPGLIEDLRWSPLGFDIAYRAGDALRVVSADGEDDRQIAPSAAPVPPAWSPQGVALIAYVDRGGRLRIADAESGETVGASPALAGIAGLEWGAGGASGLLLEFSAAAVQLRGFTAKKLFAGLELDDPRRIPLPAGARVRDAALSPDGNSVAILVALGSGNTRRSQVLLAPSNGDRPRSLFATPGRLSELAWSPRGDRLLIAWPDADQWVFVRTDGRGRDRAVGDVSGQFAPGGRGVFPRVEGWCCRPYVGAGG